MINLSYKIPPLNKKLKKEADQTNFGDNNRKSIQANKFQLNQAAFKGKRLSKIKNLYNKVVGMLKKKDSQPPIPQPVKENNNRITPEDFEKCEQLLAPKPTRLDLDVFFEYGHSGLSREKVKKILSIRRKAFEERDVETIKAFFPKLTQE